MNYTYTFIEVVRYSFIELYMKTVSVLPELVGALVIILVGFIVAPILGHIMKKIVDVFKIDSLAEKVGLTALLKNFFPRPSIAVFMGKIVKWFFILVFFMAAAEVLKLSKVTEFLNEIIFYIPNVLIAVVILVVGIIAGKFVDEVVVRSLKGAKTPINNPELLGSIARYALIVFATLAALIQLGIATTLVNILFAGVIFALALAFGLGGKDKASKLLDHFSGR